MRVCMSLCVRVHRDCERGGGGVRGEVVEQQEEPTGPGRRKGVFWWKRRGEPAEQGRGRGDEGENRVYLCISMLRPQ